MTANDISGTALNWSVSYLTNIKQYVYNNGVDSGFLLIKCGLPQGSTLGPVLVIVYISDIVNSWKLAKFIMFADDTNLL